MKKQWFMMVSALALLGVSPAVPSVQAAPAAKPAAAQPAQAGRGILSPTNLQVFQRNAENRARVPVSVKPAAQAAAVEVRAVLADGAVKGKTVGWLPLKRAGEAFEGSLNVEAGGWYRLEAQVLDAQGRTLQRLTVPRFGVGEVFITYGQSNSANFGKDRATAANPLVVAYNPRKNGWQPCRDPQPSFPGNSGARGSCWPAAGDYLADRLGLPIGFLNCGWGGASVGSLAPSETPGKKSIYDSMLLRAIRALAPVGFRAVLFHQGETDACSLTPIPVYAERLNRLIAQSRKDAGRDIPWIVANGAAIWPAHISNEEAVVLAQRRVIAGDPRVFCGPYTDAMGHIDGHRGVQTQYRGDNTHFNRRGAAVHGTWWGRAVCKHLLGLPVDEVVLRVDADTITVGKPVTYTATVRSRSGKTVQVPVEIVPQTDYDLEITGKTLTLNRAPRAERGIDNVALFAKARMPGAKTDPEETGNRLTGYAVSEPVILKIVPAPSGR